MNARRLKLLLCGKKLKGDKTLNRLLTRKYDLLIIDNFRKLYHVSAQHTVNLILLELSNDREEQLRILRKLKSNMPDVIIVVVNGGQNVQVAAEILAAGAADIFPIPYDPMLLVERVDGLLK